MENIKVDSLTYLIVNPTDESRFCNLFKKNEDEKLIIHNDDLMCDESFYMPSQIIGRKVRVIKLMSENTAQPLKKILVIKDDTPLDVFPCLDPMQLNPYATYCRYKFDICQNTHLVFTILPKSELVVTFLLEIN